MKALKYIIKSYTIHSIKGISILTLTLIITCLSMPISGHAQNKDSFLKLKGDILGDNKTHIQVFMYIDSTDSWVKTYDKTKSSRYCLLLDPEANYQVWFYCTEGNRKVLHIGAGIPGPWFKYLDIDFGSGSMYAYMQQVYNTYDYELVAVDKDFRAMSKTEPISLTSNTECND